MHCIAKPKNFLHPNWKLLWAVWVERSSNHPSGGSRLNTAHLAPTLRSLAQVARQTLWQSPGIIYGQTKARTFISVSQCEVARLNELLGRYTPPSSGWREDHSAFIITTYHSWLQANWRPPVPAHLPFQKCLTNWYRTAPGGFFLSPFQHGIADNVHWASLQLHSLSSYENMLLRSPTPAPTHFPSKNTWVLLWNLNYALEVKPFTVSIFLWLYSVSFPIRLIFQPEQSACIQNEVVRSVGGQLTLFKL